MSSFSFTYDRGTTPRILVRLATSEGYRNAVGDIDSGSDRTLCPKVYAAELGIAGADLVLHRNTGQPAVGSRFDTWRPQGIAITGQILDPASGEDGPVEWGPLFPMDLAFAETDTLLLGQRDFFAAFDLRFFTRNGEPMLGITPGAEKPRGP